jgi:hypothetical protein
MSQVPVSSPLWKLKLAPIRLSTHSTTGSTSTRKRPFSKFGLRSLVVTGSYLSMLIWTFSSSAPFKRLPTESQDHGGGCAPVTACGQSDKTGTYSVSKADSKGCSGAQQERLYLSLSSQGPAKQAATDVKIGTTGPVNTKNKAPAPESFAAKLARYIWFFK